VLRSDAFRRAILVIAAAVFVAIAILLGGAAILSVRPSQRT